MNTFEIAANLVPKAVTALSAMLAIAGVPPAVVLAIGAKLTPWLQQELRDAGATTLDAQAVTFEDRRP